MVKLATPVSNLFTNQKTTAQILAFSDLLEGRDFTHQTELQRQRLFHFELSVVNGWTQDDRKWIERIVRERETLELISFHMAACCSAPLMVGIMFQLGGKVFTRSRLLANAEENITWLKKITVSRNIKIAVENNNYYPTPAYAHVTDSEFITQIVNDNQIGFLFDLAHARITVGNRALSYKKYLAGLPMEHALQIHVCQWGVDAKGMAFDAHEVPQPALNEEVLALVKKYEIKYVTIEYYRNLKKLLQTLRSYRVLLEKEGV